MVITWQEIIDRARTYVDDDHKAEQGWITPERWLVLAQVEYMQLYRRWCRMSLISPEYTDKEFTGATAEATGVLAIIGVAEAVDESYRALRAAQPNYGRAPFRSTTEAPATEWEARGVGDELTVYIYPPDTTSTYFCRYIPTVEYVTDPDEEVDLPFGGDERLVLGLARRSHVKDSMVSSLLNGLISEADAELALTAFGRGAGPKMTYVASTPSKFSGYGLSTGLPSDPRLWRWF